MSTESILAGGSAPPASSAPPAASGGPPTPTGTPAPGTASSAPPPSWRESLPEDLKGNASISKFQDVQALAKSYVEIQKAMGDKIAVPKAGDQEGMRNALKRLGLPDTIDKYEIKQVEGSKLDPKFVDGLKAQAHKAGILPAQFQELLSGYETLAVQTIDQHRQAQATERQKGVETLKQEWGEKWDRNVESAKGAVEKFGGSEFKDFLLKTGLGDDPSVIRLMAKIGEALSEDKIDGQGNKQMGLSPEDIQARISEIHAHPAFLDRAHPEHNKLIAERGKLFEALYPEPA